MYRTFYLSFFLATCHYLGFTFSVHAQGVTIGSNNPPHPSATLDIQSTTGGLALPRLTTTQRNAIQNPTVGLQVYNTTTSCLDIYHNNGWKSVSCSCNQAPPAPTLIQGPNQVCGNQSGVNYWIAPVAGATSYTWTLPSGATLVSGQGDTAVVVNFTSGTGQITVTAQNFCGTSSPTSLSVVAQNPSPSFSANPAQPILNQPVQFTGQPSGVTYAWTFSGGNPATSTLPNPSVTWSNTGSVTIGLQVTDAQGCVGSTQQTVTVTNCPAPGTTTVTFNYTGSLQTWTVPPCATSARIRALGAQGGNTPSGQGGLGARMEGTFALTPGQVLQIIVGQQGNTDPNSSGGGGGSGVVLNGTPLIVAGGGGGINGSSTISNMQGTTSANGQAGGGNSGSGGTGGGDGGGTVYNGNNFSYGGRGFNAGANGSTGQNGQSSSTTTTQGSFGLGGGGGSVGAGHCNCGGGGGGYSGGGSGAINSSGGGGGSFNSGSSPSNASGVHSGHGQIVITY